MMEEKIQLLVLGVGVTFKFWLFDVMGRRSREQMYEHVADVSHLFFFPVKSCAGFAVERVSCSPRGVVYKGLQDRSFMICSAHGHFVTQRQQPRMALITTRVEEDEAGEVSAVLLNAPQMRELRLALRDESNAREVIGVRIFGKNMVAEDCGVEAGQWVDKYLGLERHRIVFSPSHFEKRVCENTFFPKALIKSSDQISFQDGSPILITSEASIAYISSQAKDCVTVKNFRPNILVHHTSTPFAEDMWSHVKIGAALMHGMWLNERCRVTTVDLASGTFRPDGEPLKSMHAYRDIKGHKMPILGLNLGVDQPGSIQVGDAVLAVLGEVA